MKALFIPLKTEFYDDFANSSKTEELRLYGKRWNEKTCQPGRDIVLSKGYGKHALLKGKIYKFKKQHASLFGATYQAEIKKVYGTIDIEIACISINELSPI